jgi:hypothetical protein
MARVRWDSRSRSRANVLPITTWTWLTLGALSYSKYGRKDGNSTQHEYLLIYCEVLG